LCHEPLIKYQNGLYAEYVNAGIVNIYKNKNKKNKGVVDSVYGRIGKLWVLNC